MVVEVLMVLEVLEMHSWWILHLGLISMLCIPHSCSGGTEFSEDCRLGGKGEKRSWGR